MYEVEVKVPADHDAVRERLESAGATRQGTVTQRDTYFDAPHRDFAATDEALRLRRVTDDDGDTEARLTYKGSRVEGAGKTREEHETAVADGDETTAILGGLGFDPAAVVEKRRERWGLDGYEVVLDDVTDLGEFVEVEREVPAERDVERAHRGAEDVLKALGLDPDDAVTTSYLGLLLDSQQ
ncbi:MAG: class IV adenylate cyclase [Haloferacaceae archaeon]